MFQSALVSETVQLHDLGTGVKLNKIRRPMDYSVEIS